MLHDPRRQAAAFVYRGQPAGVRSGRRERDSGFEGIGDGDGRRGGGGAAAGCVYRWEAVWRVG
ncbi:hypothetical protein LINPERPRIM_LOCUS3319 [Linum perenne]